MVNFGRWRVIALVVLCDPFCLRCQIGLPSPRHILLLVGESFESRLTGYPCPHPDYTMSDSDTSEDANLPSAAVCGERCDQFAQITGTDTALAMFYLQDRDWNVERAVNAFYESTVSEQPKAVRTPENSSAEPGGRSGDQAPGQKFTDPEPHRIRVMSWNIDGLDGDNLVTRTKAVANVIFQEKPDVVFLQEVINDSEEVLAELDQRYRRIKANDVDYYTAVLLRKSTVVYRDHTVVPFFSSKMGRSLLQVNACIKDVDSLLMTSHLESTRHHSDERKRQLARCFSIMKQADPMKTVFFGGDLNLRDTELSELGGIPEKIYDVWEVTGRRPEAKFTWDLKRNDNLVMPGRFQPRCRFDRLYVRHSEPAPKLKPVYFELVGIERLRNCQRFASDHWGILTHYDKI